MFLKDAFAISPQKTFNSTFEDGDFVVHESKTFKVIDADYAEFIPPSLLRRMGKAVKMGIGAALPLMKRNAKTDGIIIGTANGGLENCINFLNQIVDYNEGMLTPTHFVQSTPNALAGQLALMDDNPGYNVTHVNGSLSFENALVDAELFFSEQENPSSLLVGAVEEISDYNYNIDLQAGRYKKEQLSNQDLLNSATDGSVCGEGASMFILASSPEDAYAEICGVEQLTYPSEHELSERIASLLAKNELSVDDVDALVLGKSGDGRYDGWYDHVTQLFPNAEFTYYKNFVGEYRTSSAFGMYLASELLRNKLVNHPELMGNISKKPKTVLLYNQFDGVRHGLILLKNKRLS